MHEINLLTTIAGVIFLILFFTLRFFIRRAKARGEDTMIAMRNGLLVAFVLFVVFVVAYEEVREKKEKATPDSGFCAENTWECAEPPAITR